jgi:hypothetical protein
MSSNIHSLPESHFRHNAIVIYDHVHSIGLFTPTRQGRTRMVSTIRWRRSTSKNKVSTYKTLHLEAIKHARAFQTFGHVFFEKLSPCSSSVPPDGSESARIQQITRTDKLILLEKYMCPPSSETGEEWSESHYAYLHGNVSYVGCSLISQLQSGIRWKKAVTLELTLEGKIGSHGVVKLSPLQRILIPRDCCQRFLFCSFPWRSQKGMNRDSWRRDGVMNKRAWKCEYSGATHCWRRVSYWNASRG